MKVTPMTSEVQNAGVVPSNTPTPSVKFGAQNNHSASSETAQLSTTQTVTETKEAENDPFSQKYAELARREKIYRSKVSARESALKAREEALKVKESEYATSYIPKSQIPGMFQKDPYQAMRDLGLTGDQLTQALLNQPSPQDQLIQQLKTEIAELRGGQERVHKTLEDTQKQQVEQALFQIKNDVKSLVESAPEFEIIKSTGSEDSVVEYIQKHFDETGVLLPIDQAALKVETELSEELFKYAQLKKIQDRLTSAKPAVIPGSNLQQSSVNTERIPLKTLANSQVPSAYNATTARERAIAMLEGRL